MNIVTATAGWFDAPSTDGIPWPSSFKSVIGCEYTDAYSAGLLHLAPNSRLDVGASTCGRALFSVRGAGLIVAADLVYPIEKGLVVKLGRNVEYALINRSNVPFEALVIQDGAHLSSHNGSTSAAVDAYKLKADDIGTTRESIHDALEIIDSGSLDWRPFEAQGVTGYALKPSIIGAEHTAAYSIDMLRVAPTGFSAAHTDQGRHAFFILDGRGSITVDGERFDFERGDMIKVPPKSVHELRQHGSEPLLFLAIYDPPRSRK